MHGRDAAFREAGDYLGRGALDVLDDGTLAAAFKARR